MSADSCSSVSTSDSDDDDDGEWLPLAARLGIKGDALGQTDKGVSKAVKKSKEKRIKGNALGQTDKGVSKAVKKSKEKIPRKKAQPAKRSRKRVGKKRASTQDLASAQPPAQRRKVAQHQPRSSPRVVATAAAILAHQQSGQLRGRYTSFREDNPMHTGHGVARGGKDSGGVDWQAVQWYAEAAQDRSRRTNKRKRADCWDKYTVCESARRIIDSKDFAFFDQGQCGGCVFAALSYLCQLGGENLRKSWRRKTGARFRTLSTESGFKRVYEKKLKLEDGDYSNWSCGLQAFAALGWEEGLLDRISYEFFKTRRGDKFNRALCGHGGHGGGDIKDPTKYAARVLKFIAEQIDRGRVLAVPFAGHFSVIVGYHASSGGVLFLSSFGTSADTGGERGGLHELKVKPLDFADSVMDCLIVDVPQQHMPLGNVPAATQQEEVGPVDLTDSTNPARDEAVVDLT